MKAAKPAPALALWDILKSPSDKSLVLATAGQLIPLSSHHPTTAPSPQKHHFTAVPEYPNARRDCLESQEPSG